VTGPRSGAIVYNHYNASGDASWGEKYPSANFIMRFSFSDSGDFRQPVKSDDSQAFAAPTVCHQHQESTGLCVDSHAPETHVWPMPVMLRSDNTSLTATSPLELTNETFSIVGTGGGLLLRAAVSRYHAQIFSPVAKSTITKGSSLMEPAMVTLHVVVRDAESALPVTEQDESYTLTLSASGDGTIRANTTVGALRGLETFSQLIEYR